MLVDINSGKEVLTTPGEYFIRYADSKPYYDFVLGLNAKSGDDKIAVVEKDGVFYLDMDEDLVKRIKLYEGDPWARADLWTNAVFPGLKDDEIEVLLF